MWAGDFVHDACANGQKLKCLTVVDEHSRECLAVDVAGRISARRVIEVRAPGGSAWSAEVPEKQQRSAVYRQGFA